ncbi:cupin domain-containing protein [Conexibacter woesei]|uniref:Cupin 2 conserved barrel domain protein n=1 Tax=Conexibacter woesei (strain DSM 14684 / CCUG 47730 / CIP 108061 / JCM 11494 / NBRC 100937 / ID131577) TaxID=469383 RepID=D3F041_CONWI|nr:cupin domain-containing protein [Conexibacter woesei]ADB50017.1 Cupin 2 conserved barrel domain protein [Conexibacter woesei DSM 14684]
MSDQIVTGEDYAVGSLDALGEGWGFRKIRRPLGVTAFGINAIVLPPGYDTGSHYHEHQEETYFVHRGRIAITFGDGTTHELGEGGIARVAPSTVRSLKNLGEEDAIYVCVGGKDGYIERDGVKVGADGTEQS